jgi:nucleoside-diphosphate-sugar epimerase
MKNILITGKDSYIGTAVEKWLMREPDKYKVDTVDMKNGSWKEKDFSIYDVVFHVAAVVHQKERSGMKEFYFKINRDLPVQVAEKAKQAGVSQFIFMSTMSVYGVEGKIGQEIAINYDTPVNPKSFYGASKVEAESEICKLKSNDFRIVILRPPMIYGPNCPGNYARLEKLAIKLPIFPMIENKRSMLNIEKLCQLVKGYIDHEVEGIFFPQDDKYVNTSLMVKAIADSNGKSIHLSKVAGWFIVKIGKRINLFNKIFGSLFYEKE